MSETSESRKFCQLFIGGLNIVTTNETLKSYFEKWGEIKECTVVMHPHLKQSRGFGFVTFKSAQMVDDAQAARPHKIDGRLVETKRTFPPEHLYKPEARVTVQTLYVSGIEEDIGEEDLREYFGTYGAIVSVRVPTDRNTGKKRGFAFVEFDDYDPVDKIILQHHYYKGIKLEVRKSLSRAEMESIHVMKAMGVNARGRGRVQWNTAYDVHGGGYGMHSGEAYGLGRGGWNYLYGPCYPGDRGGGNFLCPAMDRGIRPSYVGGLVRDNTGYAQRAQGCGRNGGRRGSGGYGRR